MDIFIAGCGRSGTTMTAEMMRCFKDTYIRSRFQVGEAPRERAGKGTGSEAEFTDFAALDVPHSNRVIKRTGGSWKTLHKLPAHIALIYCVRHPYDVLTSLHPKGGDDYYITPRRWRDEYHALDRLRAAQPERKIFYARYEDFVSKTKEVEQKLSAFLGIELERPFSEQPRGIAISNTSLGKWRSDPARRAHVEAMPAKLGADLERFAAEFGYSLDLDAVAAI